MTYRIDMGLGVVQRCDEFGRDILMACMPFHQIAQGPEFLRDFFRGDSQQILEVYLVAYDELTERGVI